MSSEVSKSPEPYQVLFLLGAIGGIVGSLLWVLFGFGVLPFYPKVAHGQIMFFSLLWGFVAGFLMTAVPKMTSTNSANPFEMIAASLFVVAQAVSPWLLDVKSSVFLYLIQTLFLIVFIVRRFLVFKKIPFPGFLFLPFAFLMTLLGTLRFLFYETPHETLMLLAGEAFVTNLILGLGSRLIPVISRLPGALSPIERSKSETWLEPAAAAILLNAGFVVQSIGLSTAGVAIKLAAMIYIGLRFVGLLRRPTTWSFIGVGLKLSFVSMILGHIIALLTAGPSLASLHLTYIGGFASITFLISMRVMLAHGDQPLSYEVSSYRVITIFSTFLLAGLARYVAGPNPVSNFVSLSVLIFILGVFVWALKFISVLVKLRAQHESR